MPQGYLPTAPSSRRTSRRDLTSTNYPGTSNYTKWGTSAFQSLALLQGTAASCALPLASQSCMCPHFHRLSSPHDGQMEFWAGTPSSPNPNRERPTSMPAAIAHWTRIWSSKGEAWLLGAEVSRGLWERGKRHNSKNKPYLVFPRYLSE